MSFVIKSLFLAFILQAPLYASDFTLDLTKIEMYSAPHKETTPLISKTSRPYRPQTTSSEDFDSDGENIISPFTRLRNETSFQQEGQPSIIIYATPQDNPAYSPPTLRNKCCLILLGTGLGITAIGVVSFITWSVLQG